MDQYILLNKEKDFVGKTLAKKAFEFYFMFQYFQKILIQRRGGCKIFSKSDADSLPFSHADNLPVIQFPFGFPMSTSTSISISISMPMPMPIFLIKFYSNIPMLLYSVNSIWLRFRPTMPVQNIFNAEVQNAGPEKKFYSLCNPACDTILLPQVIPIFFFFFLLLVMQPAV